MQVPSGTKDVKVGSLIALIVTEGEDWKDVAIPTAGGAPVTTPTAAPSAATPRAAAAASSPSQ